MRDLRIVFMGTPEFAVGILDHVIKIGYNVVGVITAADKPAGRGQQIKYSAIKEYAITNAVTLLQPINLKDDNFIEELKSLNANLHIIVAFRMLPKVVWDLPEFGTFNLHASLLPNYRGAAPINWAIINGETKTGVTTFFIDDQIDTGAMILSKELAIDTLESAGKLHDRLMLLGCEAVAETLDNIKKNIVKTTVQIEEHELRTAYKLNKDNCQIDWKKSTIEIHNLVRGLSPYPTAWTNFIDNQNVMRLKIYEAATIIEFHKLQIGTIICTKNTIKVATLDGFLEILELQFPGKKRMKTKDLLNGISISDIAKML